jgi:hypothetical protein
MSSLSSEAPDNGFVAVYAPPIPGGNGNGENPRVLLVANTDGFGEVIADVKHFRVAHPNQSGMDIVYASVEGPEAAAYVRGTAHLVEGECTISLPDHFVSVAGADGITVQLTPLSFDSLGIAVVHKRLSGIVVKELHHGKGSYDFDWEVKCVRKGHENYEVIRPRTEASGSGRSQSKT